MKFNKIKVVKFLKGSALFSLTFVALFCSIYYPISYSRIESYNTRFKAAISDVLVADETKLRDLVNLNSDDVYASIEGDYVYLLSFNDGSFDFNQRKEKTFCVCEKELLNFIEEEKDLVSDYETRFKELFGLPITSPYSQFNLLKVKLNQVIRPGYTIQVNAPMDYIFSESTYPNGYQDWFYAYATACYTGQERIWTRLGYTYDYNYEVDDYGLSEFAILENSDVEVIYTKSIHEFVQDALGN